MKWFGRKSQIRSFDEDTAGLGGLASSYGGIQAVPVDQIVGTVGRADELQPNFMPILRPFGDGRFDAIRDRMERGDSVPPIDVYKLYDRFYVVDGHHRVAVARKIGQCMLDAVVTEFRPAMSVQAA